MGRYLDLLPDTDPPGTLDTSDCEKSEKGEKSGFSRRPGPVEAEGVAKKGVGRPEDQGAGEASFAYPRSPDAAQSLRERLLSHNSLLSHSQISNPEPVAIRTDEPPPYEVLGQAGAGERCTLCGSGRGVERVRHRGQVRLWHPTCAARYLAAMRDQPVTVPSSDKSSRADGSASLSAATPDDTCLPAEPKPAQVSQGVTGVTPIEEENKRETAPDPAAIAARAAALLAQAKRNPHITITDPDKAADYFRSRAILELAPGKPCATVHRLRPSSWSDTRDEPQALDRCGCCGGNTWWIEGGTVRRGWRCARCCPPAVPFGLRWIET